MIEVPPRRNSSWNPKGGVLTNNFPAGSTPSKVSARAGSRQSTGLRTSGGVNSPRTIQVRSQDAANWFTPTGVSKKRRMLEAKGIPCMKGWRFITVTLDPELFGFCPLTAYLAAKDHVRRFLEAGRVSGLWERLCLWAWKLEFHSNGWPHWHIPLDRKVKFTKEEMATIHKIWGLGRTNCRRISKSLFGYHFKYVFKGVYQDEDESNGLCVPQWFLDYYKPSLDGSKPKSFSRVRFWQTSKGFYTKKTRPVEIQPAESSIVPRPVRQVLNHQDCSVVVISRSYSGRYLKSKLILLSHDWQYLTRYHLWDCEHGAACCLSVRSYCMNQETLNKQINKNELWKLQPLLQKNRMLLKQAQLFRRQRVDLQTY